MNGEVFETWFFDVLIPAVPPGSVIVMNNAPYNLRIKYKASTSSSTKSEMSKLGSVHITYKCTWEKT